MTMLGKIPPIGAQLYFKGWRFKIKDADKTKIYQVIIERIEDPAIPVF